MTPDTGRQEAPPLRRAGRWAAPATATPSAPVLRRVPRAWPPPAAWLGVLLLLMLPALAFGAVAGSPVATSARAPVTPAGTAAVGPASAAGTAVSAPCPGIPAPSGRRSVRRTDLPPTPRPPFRARLHIDVDGDGCRDAVTVAGGRVTVHGVDGTAVYAIGEPHDRVIIGDWDCDGVATPLIHRPAEGLIHAFDRWPAASEAVRPSTRTVRRGATAVVVADGNCHRLVMTDP